MKKVLKNFLRNRGWAIVNTKFRWGIDIYSDLKKLFLYKKLNIILDIGANEGAFTNELIKIFPKSRIFAIEPGSKAFLVLKQRLHRFQQVTCEKFAIGEVPGISVLYTYPDSAKNTLVRSLRDYMRKKEGNHEETSIIRLDDYCNNLKIREIDFLKIDVEGNELAVLKSAEEFLKNGRIKTIFCEFHKILSIENESSSHTNLASLVDYLLRFEFRFIALYTEGIHLSESLVTCNALFAHKSFFDS